jgi:hypothetical protein
VNLQVMSWRSASSSTGSSSVSSGSVMLAPGISPGAGTLTYGVQMSTKWWLLTGHQQQQAVPRQSPVAASTAGTQINLHWNMRMSSHFSLKGSHQSLASLFFLLCVAKVERTASVEILGALQHMKQACTGV